MRYRFKTMLNRRALCRLEKREYCDLGVLDESRKLEHLSIKKEKCRDCSVFKFFKNSEKYTNLIKGKGMKKDVYSCGRKYGDDRPYPECCTLWWSEECLEKVLRKEEEE